MKTNITVQEALNRGQLIVNLPVALIMIGIMGGFIYLGAKEICPSWVVVIGFVLGFCLAWLGWSVMVTRWMIWAFPKVDNVQELRQAAVNASLIWEEGHFCEKTMIITAAQRAQLDQIALKPNIPTPILPKTYRTDDTIPKETIIYYSKSDIIFMVLVSLGISSVFVMDLWDNPKFEFKSIVDYLGIAFFLWLFMATFKQLLNINNPQLILSDKGIWCAEQADEGTHRWSDITEETVTEELNGKSWKIYLCYDYKNPKILQEALEDHQKTLPQLAQIPKLELDSFMEQYQKMEYIHPAWKAYGISEDAVENLALLYDYSTESVKLDISSYKISREPLQYLLEIYRGRHLKAQNI